MTILTEERGIAHRRDTGEMEGVVGRVQISEFIRAYNSKPTKLALQAMPSKQRVVAGMVAMIDLHLPGGVGRGAGKVLLRERKTGTVFCAFSSARIASFE